MGSIKIAHLLGEIIIPVNYASFEIWFHSVFYSLQFYNLSRTDLFYTIKFMMNLHLKDNQ